MILSSFDTVPSLVHAIDEKGNMIYANEMWYNELGYTAEEVIGKKSTDFLSDSSRKFAQTLVLPMFFKEKGIRDVPYEFIRKDGSICYILLSASAVFDVDGNFLHSIAFSTNVTSMVLGSFKESTNETHWVVDSEDFYLSLKKFRKNIGYTQEEMAEVMNLSNRTYQRIERGLSQLSAEQLIRLCKKFSVSPASFFARQSTGHYKGSFRLLLVEDQEEIASIMKAELEGFGFQVVQAHDGVEALEKVKATPFDVVITDLIMPRMDGVSFIKELKKMSLKNDPEIYVVCGVISRGEREELNLSESHIFQKPVDFDKISNRILRRFLPVVKPIVLDS